MANPSEWVVIGRFGRPHGLKAYIRVISFADPESSLLDYSPWYIRQNDEWKPIDIEFKIRQDQQLLAKPKGYENRDQVATLTHIDIAVASSQLPSLPEGEYYWQDLMHLMVSTKTGVALGEVTDLLATGSHDVLVITGEKRHLIPYIKGQTIESVDLQQGKIVVDWDEDF